VDGISDQLFKAAKQGNVEFMKHIIKASIRYGRVMISWKEARTILLYKAGNSEVIGNWRPISITNGAYRIFTCLLARAFQDINARYGVFTDPQNCFIKKTNGCSEHQIMLNELFLDARRGHKGSVITTIDFTNALGSVPHEPIMSTMRQRTVPEWTQSIASDIHTAATSIIELKGNRSDPVAWKRGMKQ
jgi:hypothetical protein